jgi:hypothetical protein
VKVDPDDVLLVGISGASDIGASSIWTSTSGMPCAAPSATCAPALRPSCISPTNAAFSGDPAVRLNHVIDAGKRHQLTSICDTSYQSALQTFGQLVTSQLGPDCLSAPLADPSAPDCTVEDVVGDIDISMPPTPIPRCSNVGDAGPCWQIDSVPVARCAQVVCVNAGDPGQHFTLSIHRPAGGAPPNTIVRATCRTAIPVVDGTGNPPQCGAPL